MEEIEETTFILTTYGSKQNLQLFCCNLPKIELHAHINGSISSKTLQDLVDKKKDKKPHLSNFKIPKKRLAIFYDFFEIFKLVYQLIDDEESLEYITKSIILDFENDGVKYLELRSTPRKNENNGMTKESYVKTIIYTIQKLSTTSKIIVRLILSIDRSITLEEAIETVDLAIKYKELGVVGVDLCGNPSKGHFDILKQAFIKAQNNGLKVTLHFGE
ncbi:6026_t:CDS:2, partial [Entrophospora sp. SA101]